jgi:hypothetical protein
MRRLECDLGPMSEARQTDLYTTELSLQQEGDYKDDTVERMRQVANKCAANTNG